MTVARSIVVLVPAETGVLESDLLGLRAIDYLLGNAGRFEDAQISVVGDAAPAFIAGLPNASARSVADLQGLDLGNRSVLLLDARFWFSYEALANLFARAEESANGLRVVSHRSGAATDFRQVETLAAVCLPLHGDRTRPLWGKPSGSVTGLGQLLDAATYAGTASYDAVQLNPAVPALEIVGCEGIAELERRLLLERAILAMRQGVRIRDPHAVYIRGELACGANVEIDVNVILEGHVVLGDGVKIGAHSLIRSSTIGERTRVNPFSIIEESKVGCGGFVGPYGRIRPGSMIGDEVQIGNYVEIKASQIGARSRINHHSFIGDAILGERVTIGAGTITCNHDGVGTNQTVIERDVYIGSGCYLIAPVRIGQDATVGAGSTISRDVPAGKLTLARSPQTTIEHWPGPRAGRMRE